VIYGGVPITCDECKNTLVFPIFSRGFTRYRDTTKKSKRKQPKADEAIEDEEGQLSIDRLLIDAPGQNTLEKNRDHFVKRGHITQLCPYCAAVALFTLQTNAPGGGQGHRAGLRGGGPLTTVILGQTLWETTWLNVLEMNKFFSHSGNSPKSKEEDKFPWLGTTHTSEKGTL
jgi:CRISPR system Cascade subunit CasA